MVPSPYMQRSRPADIKKLEKEWNVKVPNTIDKEFKEFILPKRLKK